MTAKGSTFKEYNVDEFLQKLMFTMNLFENSKYCTKCKNMKDIQEFGRGQNWCKECKNKSFKEYYNKNKEKMKENLKNDYEKRKQLIMCTCGTVIYSVSYKTHLKSKYHYNLIEKRTLLKIFPS
jgi:ATP sulfurylase